MGDVTACLISLLFLIFLLCIIAFQLMCLADFEFDHINAYDAAYRINKVVLPEFITGVLLCLFFLLTGHWCIALSCLPYLYFNVRLYMRRRHLVDVTEMFNVLDREKKQRLYKMSYMIGVLLVVMFWMIWSALEDHEFTKSLR